MTTDPSTIDAANLWRVAAASIAHMAHHEHAGDVHCRARGRVNVTAADIGSERQVVFSLHRVRLADEGGFGSVANRVDARKRHLCFSLLRFALVRARRMATGRILLRFIRGSVLKDRFRSCGNCLMERERRAVAKIEKIFIFEPPG